jgi:phage gp36-like protein
MTDQAKIALHDLFIAYLIQSSDAIDSYVRARASDPLQLTQVVLLNDSLDCAKILLTKVFHLPNRFYYC